MFTVRIWDLPTRLFHWALAACVIGLVITGNVGGNAMVWHFRLGYAVLTLVLFRLAWGFVGGHWSRWSNLPLHPRHAWAYLQTRAAERTDAGHNPLGSWSILAMLFFLLFQVSTGLISDDEIANAGPLTSLVSGSWVSWASAWHKNWGKLIIILLVEFAMDILASFTQQMQVYSLQFGLRSMFGIGALILMLEFAEAEIFNVFQDYSTTLYKLMGVAP